MLAKMTTIALALALAACAVKKSNKTSAAEASTDSTAPDAPEVPSLDLSFDQQMIFSADQPPLVTPGVCVNINLFLTFAEESNSAPEDSNSAVEMIALSTSTSTGQFFSDRDCTKSIKEVSLTIGDDSSSELYYKDSASGTATIKVTDSGKLGLKSGSRDLIIGKATQAALEVVPNSDGKPVTVHVHDCTLYSVIAKSDAGRDVFIKDAVDFTLTSSAATGLFYSNPTCTQAITIVTIAAGGVSTDPGFYYRDTAVGSPTLTATAPAAAGLKAATIATTVTAP